MIFADAHNDAFPVEWLKQQSMKCNKAENKSQAVVNSFYKLSGFETQHYLSE